MTDFPDLVNVHYFDGMSSGGDGQETVIEDGRLKARNPLYIDPTAAPYNIKFDCVTYTTASMSSSSNSTQLTVTGYTFSSDDIGKHVKVVGAGSAGADLKTTIAGISSGKAVLDAACGTTVSNAVCIFGTDNMTALNALFDDLSNTARPRKLARTAVFPIGRALYFGTLIGPARGTVKSAAENWINYDMQYGRSAGSEELQGTVLYQGWDSNADGMRFRDVATGQHDWNGHLSGILVEQDLANTSGRGISFRNANGDPLCVIDGGTLNRVAVMGFANEGFEFPNGCITAVFRDLYAFACGYLSCRNFTADTTSGSATLANVSSFTGLVSGDRLSGPGLPTDTIISVLNPGAGTITVNQIATATATGTAIQRAGDPGVRYVVHGAEAVKFDGLSGDQNSGGLIRLSGSGQVASVVLTNPKNEFGTNVYREPRLDVAPPGAPSVPQGANLVVLDNMRNANVLVENPAHWADASSSVGGTYPNTLGRDIGALILNLNTGATPPVVTWFNAQVHLATGSGQAAGYVYHDSLSVTISPVNAALAPNGTNLPPARVFRQVSDANATVATLGGFVAWSTLTAARTATLPALSTVPAGYAVVLLDKSGSASGTVTITATPAGSDAIVGDTTINAPYGKLVLESDGTRWVGRGPAPGRLTQTVISAVTLTADRDRIVLIGAGGAPTLPTAVGNPFVYRFKNTHTASRTVATTSSQTIDGATTLVLPPGSAADVVSDGSNWVVL